MKCICVPYTYSLLVEFGKPLMDKQYNQVYGETMKLKYEMCVDLTTSTRPKVYICTVAK